MNDEHSDNKLSVAGRADEIAELLALGYLRYRKRIARKSVSPFPEKPLDDVAERATVRTGDGRTLEKGV